MAEQSEQFVVAEAAVDQFGFAEYAFLQETQALPAALDVVRRAVNLDPVEPALFEKVSQQHPNGASHQAVPLELGAEPVSRFGCRRQWIEASTDDPCNTAAVPDSRCHLLLPGEFL